VGWRAKRYFTPPFNRKWLVIWCGALQTKLIFHDTLKTKLTSAIYTWHETIFPRCATGKLPDVETRDLGPV
jgi:hypothetical protein